MLVTQSCPTLCDPKDCSLTRLLCPWNSLGKNTGMGYYGLLQGIFPTQGLNLGLLNCKADSQQSEPPEVKFPYNCQTQSYLQSQVVGGHLPSSKTRASCWVLLKLSILIHLMKMVTFLRGGEVTLCGMQNLRCSTRDQTHGSFFGRVDS